VVEAQSERRSERAGVRAFRERSSAAPHPGGYVGRAHRRPQSQGPPRVQHRRDLRGRAGADRDRDQEHP